MTDTAKVEPVFALDVGGERDERVRRLASAVVDLPMSRRRRRLMIASGWAFLGIGVFVGLVGDPAGGLPLVAGSIYLLSVGSRRLVALLVARSLRRNPFAGEVFRWIADPAGWRVFSDGHDAGWSWRRTSRIEEHERGLVLVVECEHCVFDLPPEAFTSEEEKAAVRSQVAAWIASARPT